MRVNVKRTALAAALLAGVSTVAYAAGIFQSLPIIGGAAFCAASNVSGAAQTTITTQGGGVATAGQTTGTVICNVSTPAGPAVFAGTEVVPMDLYPPGTAQTAGGAQTALANITQLGQGAALDNTTAGAAFTIPAGTVNYFIDNATATQTITFPTAIEGQLQRIVCITAVGTALTLAGAAGQNTFKPATPATCAAATFWEFRFQASNNTWYRVQ